MGEATEFLGWPLSVWGVLGTWVASIGTVGAVVVSLWLARAQNKTALRIKIEFGALLQIKGYTKNGLLIEVVNISQKSVQIDGIGWRLDGKAPYTEDPMVGEIECYDPIPKILPAGTKAVYGVPVKYYGSAKRRASANNECKWMSGFLDSLLFLDYNWRDFNNLNVAVCAADGYEANAKAPSELISEIAISHKVQKEHEEQMVQQMVDSEFGGKNE